MLLPIPTILVLHVACITLAQSQSSHTSGQDVSPVSTEIQQTTTCTGEMEGRLQEILMRIRSNRYPRNTGKQGRVSLLREGREYRRPWATQRLQTQSRHPDKKAPVQRKTFLPNPRHRSTGRETYNLNSTTRQSPTFHAKIKPKADAEQTTKKYAGVMFPRLNLFPRLPKTGLSRKKGSKLNTSHLVKMKFSPERSGPAIRPKFRPYREGSKVNATLLDTEKSSQKRFRPEIRRNNNRPKVKTPSQTKKYRSQARSRPDNRTTPSQSRDIQPTPSLSRPYIRPTPSLSRPDIRTAPSLSRPDIRPTPSLSRDHSANAQSIFPSKEDDNHSTAVDLLSGIPPDKDGLITVTHTIFTRTRQDYEETLTSLSEVVDITNLRSTTISNREIMFAYSEFNHPSRGVTEFTFEEIRPTQTYVPHSKTFVPAYNILTHTTRLTNDMDTTSLPDKAEGQVAKILQNIIPRMLPTTPLVSSTSYTTITLTKVSTITSEVTSDITITLAGRPVRTEYVIPTTMVITDLHISRSAILVWP